MKKKIAGLIVLMLALVVSVCGLFACGINEANSGNTDYDAELYEVYELYVARQQGSGLAVLSYNDWLNNIREEIKAELRGEDGKSAYQIWLDNGHTGSEADFLAWLKGEGGKSAYQIWLDNGHTGTETDFLNWLKGDGDDENSQGLDFYPLPDGTYAVEVGKAKYLENIIILSTYKGKTVSAIGNNAFYYCSSLTSITIPNSVTSIGEDAFYYCTSLTSITIPDSVTSIDYCAFSGCSSLTSITIPDSVTSIGSYSFGRCSSLTSVTIGNSVTSIEKGVFFDCSSLTKVYYKGTASEWNNISIEDFDNNYLTDTTRYYYSETEPTTEDNFWHYVNGNIAEWENRATYTKGLTYTLNSEETEYSVTGMGTSTDANVILPSTINGLPVTSIGNNAFKDVDFITSITIPDSVKFIGNESLDECDLLSIVVIGSGVNTIGENAFEHGVALTKVFYKGTEQQWNLILIRMNNEPMLNTPRYYYSETQPTEQGNFWHYVDGVVTEW